MMRTLTALVLLVAGFTSAGWAQASAPNAAAAVEKAQWLERAKLITAAIQEDAPNLPPDLQFILPGRLANIWLAVDRKRAQGWLDEALSRITSPPEQESTEARKARLEAGSALLQGLNQSDPPSADRLLDSMVADVQRAPTPPGAFYNPDMTLLGHFLSGAIMSTARENPERAFQLSQRIVQLGDGNEVVSAYLNLRSADPQLADRFAMDALQAARGNNYNAFLFFGLAQLLAPDLPERLRASDAVSAAILQSLASGLLRPPQSAADRQSICDLAPPVTMAMKKFSPEQQGPLQVAVDNCKKLNSPMARMVADMETRNRDNAPAELLKEAADAGDARSRASLKLEAAARAEREKDFQRALDIWESFTPEEREARPTWPWQWRYAAQEAMRASYGTHDLQSVQQLIARAPDKERAELILTAAILGFSSKDVSYGISMLRQARRELEKNPVTDNYRIYLQLLQVYARHAPEEAVPVLRLAVSGINSFKVPEKAQVKLSPPGWHLEPIRVPGAVLDSDPQMTAAAVSELESPQARVAMRLGMLEACLQRYQGPARSPAPKTDSKTPATPTPKTDTSPPAQPASEQKKN